MEYNFNKLAENSYIVLHIHTKESHMTMGALIQKHLKDNLTVITLDYSGTQCLVFNNVRVDVEYTKDGSIPTLWKNVKVINYKNTYILQVTDKGMRNNRRHFFRVNINITTWCSPEGKKPQQVVVKDVSLTGFSVADRGNKLNLEKGDRVSVSFEDIGHQLDLSGQVIRIEERDQTVIYGMTIQNLCNDLSSYINMKQRRIKK